MVALASGVLALALSPPLLSPMGRAVVMNVFDPVCHQLSVRSPVLGGVQVAVCDRCVGIYVGIVLGVASAGWGRRMWKKAEHHVRYVIFGSLVPLGLDWIGPVLGLWTNIPESRALTGLVFGAVVASFASDRVLRAVDRWGTERAAGGDA
jgi:uncharacterized membrane protein